MFLVFCIRRTQQIQSGPINHSARTRRAYSSAPPLPQPRQTKARTRGAPSYPYICGNNKHQATDPRVSPKAVRIRPYTLRWLTQEHAQHNSRVLVWHHLTLVMCRVLIRPSTCTCSTHCAIDARRARIPSWFAPDLGFVVVSTFTAALRAVAGSSVDPIRHAIFTLSPFHANPARKTQYR